MLKKYRLIINCPCYNTIRYSYIYIYVYVINVYTYIYIYIHLLQILNLYEGKEGRKNLKNKQNLI